MIGILDSLGLWFADYYILSAALLALLLIALRIVPQPVHRLAIVKSTLVALALLAGLCALPGWSVIHLITTQHNAMPPVPQVASPTLDAAALKHMVLLSDGNQSAEQPHVTTSVVLPVQSQTPTWNASWYEMLAIAQIAGACSVLVWLAIGAVAARRLRLSSAAAPPGLQKLLQYLAPPSRVDLRTSSQITVPVALGLYRPLILLPLSFAETQSVVRNPQSEIGTVLAHELAHIRNRDLHWLAASRALMILLWSQPLYWFARRRMRLDQESLADAAAADVSSRERYAEQLVDWARNLGSCRTVRIASAVGLWEGPSQLRQRIALLLDDRFIVLRHFSRKLQFVVIALCVLTAAALSLVTLEPAQSKPQEKPAISGAAPSDNEKLNEPDHITIADRLILCPVTTELQRSLLGDVDAPKSNASLCVFANYGAYEGDTVEPNSTFFAGLSEQLSKLAKRDNRCAIVNVQVGQISQPFDKLRGRAEQLSKLIEKLTRDAGFKQARWGVTYQGTTLSWSEIAANAEAAAKLAESSVEDSIGDDQVRVFPVRTFLSRMLMEGADCVVNIRPVWQMADGPNFVDSFVPSLKRLVPELKYVRKELMYVRIRYAGDAQPFVDQWSGNLERSKKFGQELGFADSRNQLAQVSDEDAKQDKEARTAKSAAPAGAAADKADLPPALFPPPEGSDQTNSISVLSVDENGKPLENVDIKIYRVKPMSGEPPRLIVASRTGSDGKQLFADLIPLDAFPWSAEYLNGVIPTTPITANGTALVMVVAKSKGRASTWTGYPEITVLKHRTNVELRLPLAATIRGRVTDTSGRPVAGAWVSRSQTGIDDAQTARTDSEGNYVIDDAAAFTFSAEQKKQFEQQKSTWTTGRVAIGPPTLFVRHPEYAEKWQSFDKIPGTVDFVLEQGGSIQGRVVSSGRESQPKFPVSVWIDSQDDPNLPPSQRKPPQLVFARTDDHGNYKASSLRPGVYDVYCDAPGWYCSDVNAGLTDVKVESSKTTTAQNLVLQLGTPVTVHLVDATTDKPLTFDNPIDTEAILVPKPGNMGRTKAIQIKIDRSGEFIVALPPGELSLQVFAGPWEVVAGRDSIFTVPANEPYTISLRARKREQTREQPPAALQARPEFKPNVIAGLAFDEKHEPVAGAEVFLFRYNYRDSTRKLLGETKTDDAGKFHFDNVIDIATEFPNGKIPPQNQLGDEFIQCIVRRTGLVGFEMMDWPTRVAEQGLYRASLMPVGGKLTGRITGPDRAPIAGALVTVGRGFGNWEGINSARTDADGNYKISDLPPFDLAAYKKQAEQTPKGVFSNTFIASPQSLTIDAPSFAMKQTPLLKVPGQQDVQLASPAILEGRVVYADSNQPASDILVQASTMITPQSAPFFAPAAEMPVKVPARTDQAGNYRFTKLPPGSYSISAEIPDWVTNGIVVTDATNEKPRQLPNLTLSKGGIISARIVDSDTRQPIPLEAGIRIMLVAQSSSAPPEAVPVTRSNIEQNAQGRFEMRAPPGKKSVVIGAINIPGGVPTWLSRKPAEATVVEGQTVEVDVPVTKVAPEPTGTFTPR